MYARYLKSNMVDALSIRDASSALSPGVRHMLCEVGVKTPVNCHFHGHGSIFPSGAAYNRDDNNDHHSIASSQFEEAFDAVGLIQIDQCAKILPPAYAEISMQFYEECVSSLAPVFKLSEELLENMPQEEFLHKYGEFYTWTKNPQLFLECFELLTHRVGAEDLLSLLLLCGGLERALGNLYLLKGSQCPALLKDLLATQELEDVLDSAAIKLLHVIIGPPISMNIRNVSWHGFLTENELPRRYIYFLLLLVGSLGKLVKGKGINPESIKCKDYIPLNQAGEIAKQLDISDAHLLSHEQSILNSWMVNKGNSNLYKSAIKWYRCQKYGWCAVQLLPLLEHALRRIFVVVNSCPDRLITAEATTFYTTFEEILDCCLPDGSENKLIKVLGTPCLDLLHDLLIYPSGPRARDKLGHGEADYADVPESLARILMFLLLHLACMAHDETAENSVMSELRPCSIDDYTSVFHPVAMLHQKILHLSTQADQMFEDLHTSPDLEPWCVADGYNVLLSNNQMFTDIQSSFSTLLCNISVSLGKSDDILQRLKDPIHAIQQDISSILPSKMRTLYRWQVLKEPGPGNAQISESEIVGLLSRIITETETCLTQTKQAIQLRQEQLVNKQLRSRQRDNMKRLLALLPCASLLAHYIAVLSTWIFCHLDHYNKLDNSAQRTLQRFLKSTLRTSENARSFTSADSNKWSQAGEITLNELKSAVDFSRQDVFSTLR